jgi:hypothetical protein
MEYTIDTANLPAHVSMTPVPVYDSLEVKVAKAPVTRPSLWKRVAVYGALLLGLGVAACGPGPNPNDPINPIPSGYSVSDNMSPADGSTVTGSDLEVGLQTPAVPAACAADADCAAAASAGLDVSYDIVSDNATPGNASDDVVLGTDNQTGVPFDSYTSTTVDLTGVPDGAGIEARVTVTGTDSEGTEHSVDGSADYVFDAGVTGPTANCDDVWSANIGNSLGINCTCSDPADSFSLTGGPEGARIFNDGGIITTRLLEASDVGLHTYSVTCTAGGVTGPAYEFTVPVDTHRSTLVLTCAEGSNVPLLLPEISVDAVATACGHGLFDDSRKPASSADPEYIVDLDPACIDGAINALTADERAAHEHYNNGTTVSNVYTSCTVISPSQAEYISNN